MAFSLKTIQTHYTTEHVRNRHIWHYCWIGQHEKCAVYGSLVRNDDNPNKTHVEKYQGMGFETVFCECPCHAAKEGYHESIP